MNAKMITIHEQEYDDVAYDFGDIQKVITPAHSYPGLR